MSWRERNIAPYPQHMTGILGPIAEYHSKLKVDYKNSLKKSEKGKGEGGALASPPLNPPVFIKQY